MKFNNELKNILTKDNIDNCSKFDEMFLEVLDTYAQLKRKLLRGNHASYVPKSLRQVIMRRSYLGKLYFKNHTENSLKAFKKQKKILVDTTKKKQVQCSNGPPLLRLKSQTSQK